jgi:predicted nucleic acid-binding protein
VLAWAVAHPGADVVLDDRAARRFALDLGLRVRGTLGLVLLAKRHAVIPAARPVVEQLRATGLYLSDKLMSQALALVGE